MPTWIDKIDGCILGMTRPPDYVALMSRGQGRTAYRTSKELADNPGGLFPFTLQREMAGVEQVDFGVRIIALKGIGACAYNKPAPPAFSVPAKRRKT